MHGRALCYSHPDEARVGAVAGQEPFQKTHQSPTREQETVLFANLTSLPSVYRHKFAPITRAAWLIACAYVCAGCAEAPSILDPRGPAAREIANLWWILFGLAMAVYVAVLGFLYFAVTRRIEIQDNPTPNDPQPHNNGDKVSRQGTRIIVVAGIIIPALILLTTLGFTIRSLRILAMPDIPEEFTIHVIGHQWWWEVRYPHHGVVTANEIHLPAGQPVKVVLTSEDVIHSFWVPELHGKLDMVPEQVNTFWLEADAPGIYWGECAEFCGVQHAKMQFVVVAQDLSTYAAWLEQQQQPAKIPTDPLAQQGAAIFLSAGCTQCHRIAGTDATGSLGPDLTHLASRRTLAAGTVPNTLGHLSGWITDPQHTKPGALMPATDLSGTELQALLAYLASLQ
jgi:cytochrome c oxidase subunit II